MRMKEQLALAEIERAQIALSEAYKTIGGGHEARRLANKRMTGMSDSKHTPGPWSVSDETTRDGLRSKLIHGMPEGMLAIVRVEHQGRYYGDANARLIAAAPDLLHALLCLKDWVEDHAVKPLEISEMQTAIAAITKAEGR